jgi:hypothetical protein
LAYAVVSIKWSSSGIVSNTEVIPGSKSRSLRCRGLRNRARANGPKIVVYLRRGTIYDPGRVRVVKLVFTAGTTQASRGGQPASVVGFRQSDVVAGLTSEG